MIQFYDIIFPEQKNTKGYKMATGDYNSPYTGAQLDDTIRKISNNDIHSYVEVFSNTAGAATVNLNSLPAGPDGLRTGTYDILYSYAGSTSGSRSTSRLIIHDVSATSTGTGHADASESNGNITLGFSHAQLDGASKDISAITDQVNITANSVVVNHGLAIYKIYRQDTII